MSDEIKILKRDKKSVKIKIENIILDFYKMKGALRFDFISYDPDTSKPPQELLALAYKKAGAILKQEEEKTAHEKQNKIKKKEKHLSLLSLL